MAEETISTLSWFFFTTVSSDPMRIHGMCWKGILAGKRLICRLRVWWQRRLTTTNRNDNVIIVRQDANCTVWLLRNKTRECYGWFRIGTCPEGFRLWQQRRRTCEKRKWALVHCWSWRYTSPIQRKCRNVTSISCTTTEITRKDRSSQRTSRFWCMLWSIQTSSNSTSIIYMKVHLE